MRDENKTARKQRIEAAALELLAEKGYLATSMLSVAKRARASNETLYNWYGNKQGLFRSLVEANAGEVKALLENDLAQERPPEATLKALGPLLLGLLVSDKAITLNRAAAADPSGELARELTQAGRDTVAPLIADVFIKARGAGILAFDDAGEAVGLYLDLLVGDLQIRRVLGAVPVLTQAGTDRRAAVALDNLLILLKVGEDVN
ncbi:TetR family transcriptional regulator [Anderseniella sp. Alg231-50]|uniref:TetR family transcriptional regulator n=1 Tax=Anderseniella sp. Alg231-50 TaxID=1922226 RepID=UPI000D54C0D5